MGHAEADSTSRPGRLGYHLRPMDADGRQLLIDRYAAGPARLRDALSRVPQPALRWRPAADRWSAHEVVCHCADSETISSTRIRFLVGEDEPTIAGYDQDRWARRFDYHAQSLDLALRQIDQVRAWTTAWIRALPDSAWSREGTHTESGRYSAGTWLKIYAEHLEIHARQIERILAAWQARPVA
jgi:DinB superfamily